MDRICIISKITGKGEKLVKRGLQKGEEFDIITYVAEKDGIKTENLKKVFKKT